MHLIAEGDEIEVIVQPDKKNHVVLSPRYRDSVVRFEDLPDGAEILVNGVSRGAWPGTSRVILDRDDTYQFVVRLGERTLLDSTVRRGLEGDDLKPGEQHVLRPDPSD